MKVHPLAAKFPKIEGVERDKIRDDMRLHGMKKPVVLYNGDIIEGVNRHAICLEAGRKPSFTDYNGDTDDGSLKEYVWRENSLRRHLSASQRALIAVELFGDATPPNRSEPSSAPNRGLAQQAEVSVREIRQAKQVAAKATPAVKEAVVNGKMSLKKAAKTIATKPSTNGKQVHDPRTWERWHDLFGKLKRATDDVNRSYAHGNLSRRMHAELEVVFQTAKEWKRSVR